jgi:hypothetical protein
VVQTSCWDGETVNPGAFISTAICAEALCPFELPDTSKRKLPRIASAAAITVRTLDVLTGFALKDAVTPGGRAGRLSVTAPEKPPNACKLIVVVLEAPC